jgi:hypothetical protein
VAELLSFSHQSRGPKIHPLAGDEPSDETLTQRLHASLPQLVPAAFKISALPSEILCFTTQVLVLVESSWIRKKKRPTKHMTESGTDGRIFVTPPESPITSSSLIYPKTPASSSPEPSSRCTGPLPGTSPEALLANVASQLATAFRDHYQRSPLHVKGSTKLLPSVRALLRAFDNVDPPQNRQRAVTFKFLKALLAYCQATYARDSLQCRTADLIVAAFFFAMRACEYTGTARPGRTKVAIIKYVIFRDRTRKVLSHRDPELKDKAYFITLVFVDQKNGTKLDARTQRRTGDPSLCPPSVGRPSFKD